MNEDIRNEIISFIVNEGPPQNFFYELPDSIVIKRYAKWPDDRHCYGWEFYRDDIEKATDKELTRILLDTILAWESWYIDEVNKKYGTE